MNRRSSLHVLSVRNPALTPARARLRAASLLLVALLIGCDDGGSTTSSPQDDATADTSPPLPTVTADLRLDANRDGVASVTDPADDDGEDTWRPDHGAIFLANLDDDTSRCQAFDSEGYPVPDSDLAACNDAQDDRVNGDLDARDLAPVAIAPWPDAPDDATATLSLTPTRYSRLFLQRTDGSWQILRPGDTLDAATLRAGATLGLEGTTLVTRSDQWDGVITLTLSVQAALDPLTGEPALTAEDTAQAKVAPLILQHHLEPATQVWAADTLPSGGDPSSPEGRFAALDTQSTQQFRADLTAATLTATTGGFDPLSADPYYEDRWTQDLFEAGWSSMPGPDGQPHMIRLILRTASGNRDLSPFDPAARDYPLRMASRVVFEQMRGLDIGGVQAYDPNASPQFDTLNSFGNLEVIPPHSGPDGTAYPQGRVLIGHAPHYPSDSAVRRLLESQGAQPPLYLDTSWLLVGHVDEFLTFIPADTPRGWALLKFDGGLAIRMLEQARDDGHGDAVAFPDLTRYIYPENYEDPLIEQPAAVTIQALLDDPDIMAATAAAAAQADAQADALIAAVGLSPDEVFSIPFLMEESYGQHVAFGPGIVNGLVLSKGHFAAPTPHGPRINGQDLWVTYTEQTLQAPPLNTTTYWVEDWYSYHLQLGEVHCGTNALRQPPADLLTWWK